MQNYALINESGIITNIIVWDGESDLPLEDGITVQELVEGTQYNVGLEVGEALEQEEYS